MNINNITEEQIGKLYEEIVNRLPGKPTLTVNPEIIESIDKLILIKKNEIVSNEKKIKLKKTKIKIKKMLKVISYAMVAGGYFGLMQKPDIYKLNLSVGFIISHYFSNKFIEDSNKKNDLISAGDVNQFNYIKADLVLAFIFLLLETGILFTIFENSVPEEYASLLLLVFGCHIGISSNIKCSNHKQKLLDLQNQNEALAEKFSKLQLLKEELENASIKTDIKVYKKEIKN